MNNISGVIFLDRDGVEVGRLSEIDPEAFLALDCATITPREKPE